MHLPSWRNRNKTEDFVREARPAPSRTLEERLLQMVGRNPAPRAGLRRSVFALSFTVLVLAGLAAGGGISYAAHIVAEPVVAFKVHVLQIHTTQVPSVRRYSAAISQYGGGGGGGETTTTTTTSTTTTTTTQTTTTSGAVYVQPGSGEQVQVHQTQGGIEVDGTSGDDNIYSTPGLSNLTVIDLQGNNTIHLVGSDNKATTGAGDDTITLFGTGSETINADGGDNNIHIGGAGTHTVTTGAGNSAIRAYGGTNNIKANGPGNSDIVAKGGKGTITVGKGGSTVNTTKDSVYNIDVANGSKDTVNCHGAKDNVTYDGGLDRIKNCTGKLTAK